MDPNRRNENKCRNQKQFHGNFPNAKIGLHYGMSELMRATMLLLPDEKEKIHTEGKPRPGVQIRTLDECGMKTKPGIAGEIAVKGSCLASGYDQIDAWRKRLNKDGWFLTRDIGTIDGMAISYTKAEWTTSSITTVC